MDPSVTVIIPTYNNEQTIKNCIDSVLNQSLKDIEVIIINDGSTDKTQEILNLYSINNRRIRVFQKSREGQGIARNLGMEKARGKYIGFVDGDDTIDRDMYKYMLIKAQKYNSEIVQCNITDVYPDGSYILRLPDINKVVYMKNRRKYFAEYLFGNIHTFECCNKLIKKDFLLNNNIIFENNDKVYAEDLLFNLDIAAKLNKIVFMGKSYYNYYQYETSHSKVNKIAKTEKLLVLFDIFYRKENKLRFECAKIAILIIMINLSQILNSDKEKEKARVKIKVKAKVKEILKRRDIKKYLTLSFLSSRNIRHKMLMLLLLCTPTKVKFLIIRLYYSRFK